MPSPERGQGAQRKPAREAASSRVRGAVAARSRAGQPLMVNFSWTLAGHAVFAASQWALMVAVARFAAPEAVGRFALGTAVTAPLFLLAGLSMNATQVTDAGHEFAFSDYLGVRMAGMASALVVCAGMVLSFGYDRESRLVIMAVGLMKAIEGLSDIHYGCWQRHERMRAMSESLILRGLLGVVAMGAVLWSGGGLLLAILAVCAGWGGVLLAHDVRSTAALLGGAARSCGPRLQWADARRIVATSLPLGLVLMLISLRTNVPRYFIEQRVGTAELGIFAALSSLVAAANLVVAALGQSATPRLARHYFEGDGDAFRRLLAKLLGVALLLGLAGVALVSVAGAPLLRGLFGSAYAARADVLVWLMVAGLVAFVSSFLGCALTATRSFTVQLPLFAFTAAVCAAASWVLVPRRGLVGATWAWGASLLLEALATALLLRRSLRARCGAPGEGREPERQAGGGIMGGGATG